MTSRSRRVTTDRFRTMLDRMVKTAKVNGETILSLKEDPAATGQALTVLAIAGLSLGVWFTTSIGLEARYILLGAIFGAILSIVLGFVWLSLTFLIGTRIFGVTLDYWSLARPMFFATSPGLAFLFMSIPVWVVSDIARAVGAVWVPIVSAYVVRSVL